MSVEVAKGIYLHECNRCEAKWASSKKEPKTCAKCRSPYWNKPRIR